MHSLIAQTSDDQWKLVMILGLAFLAVSWSVLRWVFPTENSDSAAGPTS